MTNDSRNHKVVGREEWLRARKKLLVKEKEFTRMQEELNAERCNQPWVRVTKELSVRWTERPGDAGGSVRGAQPAHHLPFLMFGPKDEQGCPHCSLRADGFNGINIHLKQRDVTMIAVSRAPYEKLAA